MSRQNRPATADLEAIRANYSLANEQRQVADHVDRVSREVLHPLQPHEEGWCPENLFRQMGELVRALGLTEPGEGSDTLDSMRTTTKRDGDDYILNGTKSDITNGPIADLVLVYAKTSPEKGAKGIAALIVKTDTSGFKVAQKLNKMGFRGSPTGELVFEDCRGPAKNMVGTRDGGVAVTMSELDLERAIVCFNAMGIAQWALDISVDYARRRAACRWRRRPCARVWTRAKVGVAKFTNSLRQRSSRPPGRRHSCWTRPSRSTVTWATYAIPK